MMPLKWQPELSLCEDEAHLFFRECTQHFGGLYAVQTFEIGHCSDEEMQREFQIFFSCTIVQHGVAAVGLVQTHDTEV
jgi:hypothetical protein